MSAKKADSASTPKKTTRRLGRGLSSLISEVPDVAPDDAPAQATGTYEPAAGQDVAQAGQPREVSVEQITSNPYQPRRDFDQAALAELTQSIRQDGILQPLVITDSKDHAGTSDKPYALIAGERRLRAAKLAGLQAVPCVVRQATERQMAEWAVIENIQRSDLNPIERAQAYRDYIGRYKLTQAQAAERMGQARATLANYLRLNDLCEEAQSLVASGQVSFGHAKVLAGLPGEAEKQTHLARRVVAEGISVRKLERLAAAEPKTAKPAEPKPPKADKPAYVRDIEQQLTEAVGTRVTILPGRAKNSGKIVVEYYSLDDFDKIANALGLDTQD
ncbi:MAG: ParB/RepB/Spo0J family partition protein [Phycisphaerae bacterium]|nr:ParB/RepB/Spo0J family partition protein [Phycisphaerae bacterium]